MSLHDETTARSLARQTHSMTQLTLYALLGGTFAVMAEAAPEGIAPVVVHAHASAGTASSLDVQHENLDSEVAGELERVMRDIASSQRELDRQAKHVLYTRMKELYRR
jgi:hypothetical protein